MQTAQPTELTGLFFGSFNPIHVGHLIIANYMAQLNGLKEVWLVVSPHNPLKSKSGLANMYDRLEMVQLAIENAPKLRASDIEFQLPQPSYTIDTLTYMKEKYPDKRFALIMGADNLTSLHKWKNHELLLRDYPVYVYPRPGAAIENWRDHPSINVTNTPVMEISSTFIRKAIKEGRDIRFFVPEAVQHFIEQKNMYR